MLTIKRLTTNYEVNPNGIGKEIQFGWVLQSDRRNVLQEAYQLQIAIDSQFKQVIYDSGLVKSEASHQISPLGLELKSMQKYYYRVNVTDNKGETTGYSEPGYFITGILQSEEWQAEFISAETLKDAENAKGTYIRKAFQVPKKIKSAYVVSTALGLYHLYLNGKKIGNDQMAPGWTSYKKHLVYQLYDITTELTEGENVIGAMLGAGWYKGKMGFVGLRNHYGKQTALLCQIKLTYEDDTTEVISTNKNWKGYDAPVVFSEIYDGEIYDAQLEQRGWNKAGFNDEAWRTVESIDFDKKVLQPQGGGRVQVIETIEPKRIFKTPQGDTVIDFGQNLTGWVQFKVKGKKGDKVEITCFEVLDKDGNVYLDNLRGAKQTLIYYCKDEEEAVYEPHFTFQGFQYAKITSYPGEIKVCNFEAQVVHSKMAPTGSFECSNPDVNQLQHNILWGLKGNFLDIPTDCPQRNERLGWTGDAQIFCRTASYLVNTYTFFSKWLRDVKADQTPEGGVPHVVPDILTGKSDHDWLLSQGTHSAAAWADAAVINPWTLYLTFGDKQILKEQYDSMRSWVEFMRTHAEGVVWNYKLQFGDWVALDAKEGSYFGATPNELTGTAYYAYSTELLAKTAKVLGKEEDYKTYTKLHQEVVEGFQKLFFKADGTMTAQTQTAHILALHFNLVPEAYKEKTVEGLIKLLNKENGHLVTGFVGTPYFCHALSKNGHTKEAYELLLKDDFPSWLYQVKMGATTVWEHWDGLKPDGSMWSADMNSFNHYAYGAIGEWLYRVVAGLEIDEEKPGYKHTIIAPHIGGDLDYVKASYDSIYGKVTSNWEVKDNKVSLEVTVPANTTATLYLDQAKQIVETDGITFNQGETCTYATLGSGSYRVVYEIN
ncbi:alpha-L-rhamnosidase [Sporanaerobium hydrogeniformans]|uniref:Alpha-L-rhamnosidase n=1 Tax=Sporanaerobium hydrogeniformans TaxID=3072179 RepID=A0AC61DCF8_9FIRM|nr:glycoside hydrolase family 78 protein [Sporanaerobium hydrogeniformans]PHV70252.1 alpha-L-rhamnosidase [Sporanaerobium hydrogeniformans]